MRIALFGQIDNAQGGSLGERLRSEGAEVADYRYGYDSIPAENIDLVLSLGGDGTFLREINFLRGRAIPVAGINFGHLGFLTTAKMNGCDDEWISALASGSFNVEERMLLEVASDALPEGFFPCGRNEFTVHRQNASMLRVDVKIGDKSLPPYWADGIVVATPTGSTAYSLSVGGPVVTPDTEAFIVAPIASHNLNVRPLIIPASSEIELLIHSKSSGAVISVDNRNFDLNEGTRVVVRQSRYKAFYVSLRDNSFIEALSDKLLWGMDRRNE